jgi:hypothetical protein
LPPTLQAITGGGGFHLYFRAPEGVEIRNSAGKLGAGVDVRGNGGYVLLPPSLHISGRRYAWEPGLRDKGIGLAPLPDWVAAALAEPKASKAATLNWRELAAATVVEGKRNESIARFSGHLLRHYVDPCVVLELLLSWNMVHCSPPLSNKEVATTVNSIAGKEMHRRISRRPR